MKQAENVLAPLTGEVKAGGRFSTLDIETKGLDARPSAFRMGVIFDGERPLRFTEVQAMRDYLLNSREGRGRTYYAHNGGGYDYLALFGNLFTTFGSENVVLIQSRFIQAVKRSGKNVTRFRDSLNLIPAALAQIGERLGYPKGKTPQKFIDATDEPLVEEDWTYCELDCRVLHAALLRLQEQVGELRATIPSTAMAVFRRSHLPEPVWIRRIEDGLFYDAYFGGRVEAYRIGKIPEPNFYYDVNSLYPTAMLGDAYPDPSHLYRERWPDVRRLSAIMESYEGCARVYIDHPSTYIGYLPKKLDTGKLVFPVGRYWGTWTFPELRYALSRGLVIAKCEWLVYGPRLPSPFASYVHKFYGLKKTATGFDREIYKLMLNALYGKFAESHSEREIYAEFMDPDEYDRLSLEYGDVTWQPLGFDRTDGYYVCQSDDAFTSHTIYSWASYITAYARVRNATIQDQIRGLGLKVFYTDTDSFLSSGSLVTSAELPEALVGEELGQLKQEKYVVSWIGGNKDYRMNDGTFRLKGVKRDAKQISENVYQFPAVMKLRQAIRRNLPAGTPYLMARELSRKYDKRTVLPNGDTQPLVIMENE